MADTTDVVDLPGMAPAVAQGCICVPQDAPENKILRWPDWDCRGCPVHEEAQNAPMHEHVSNRY